MAAGDADQLREAAALMRQRAQAATPGPWTYLYKNQIDTPVIDVSEANWGGENLSGYCLTCQEDSGAWRESDAEHMASWHPQVALAVADWLDQASGRVSTGPGECGDDYWDAVSVARTYLGRDGG